MPEQFMRIGGSDGEVARGLRTDTTGRLEVEVNNKVRWKTIVEPTTVSAQGESYVGFSEAETNLIGHVFFINATHNLDLSIDILWRARGDRTADYITHSHPLIEHYTSSGGTRPIFIPISQLQGSHYSLVIKNHTNLAFKIEVDKVLG